MKRLDATDRKLLSQDAQGQAYLRYYDVTGGEPIGLTVPYGYPDGVEQMGGVIAVYEGCIKLGVTWETLLGVVYDDDVFY